MKNSLYTSQNTGAGILVTDLRDQVRRYLAEYFMTDDMPGDEELLVEDLGADSLDLLQVAHNLNDMFDINIDTESLPDMLMVGSACDLVERLRYGD
ncbi:acyl carrier protein [Solimicrobium silvestre]|uniref:Acyl carrier protein n=1 Tax=Solimicrobium silvestre TaxID=2099400 RepID=A0A2S9H1Q3_9BURK|nr:acyl carrier protein [Solimicrobium silvestre]PRC93873.1 Acyl carrier protein [Solimicrobium silvestre]